MTDRAPVEFMHRLFGGSFRGPLDNRPWGTKPMFEWCLSGEARVRLLYDALRSWLSPRRRKQFKTALARKGGKNAWSRLRVETQAGSRSNRRL
jgi:hypothetical protein